MDNRVFEAGTVAADLKSIRYELALEQENGKNLSNNHIGSW
ncbi:MAG: hypothetical protein WBD01_13670 [Salaquimonas sp.]